MLAPYRRPDPRPGLPTLEPRPVADGWLSRLVCGWLESLDSPSTLNRAGWLFNAAALAVVVACLLLAALIR